VQEVKPEAVALVKSKVKSAESSKETAPQAAVRQNRRKAPSVVARSSGKVSAKKRELPRKPDVSVEPEDVANQLPEKTKARKATVSARKSTAKKTTGTVKKARTANERSTKSKSGNAVKREGRRGIRLKVSDSGGIES